MPARTEADGARTATPARPVTRTSDLWSHGSMDLKERREVFKRFFHRKADLADHLWLDPYLRAESALVATTALDALGLLWFDRMPEAETNLAKEFGGRVPDAIRMSRLLTTFSGDARASLVAVVPFAEDLHHFAPRLRCAAEALLAPRRGRSRNEPPRSYLDKPVAEVFTEVPGLDQVDGMRLMIEEYVYGALLYRFVRCPLVHASARSSRFHGFSDKEEVMYMRLDRIRTALSLGPKLVSNWLRNVATNYADACVRVGKDPGPERIDRRLEAEENLRAKWSRVSGRRSVKGCLSRAPSRPARRLPA